MNKEEICDYSKDGKCYHYYSQGELQCNGTNEKKINCIEHTEVE